MFFLTDTLTGQATSFEGRDGLKGALEDLFGTIVDFRVPPLLTAFERGEDIGAFEEHLQIKITEI